jgi:heat shock protein HslJ
MTRARSRSFVLWLAIGVLSLSCHSGAPEVRWTELAPPPAEASQVLTFAGTVQFLDLEGGLYVIRDSLGTQYQPTNLPEAFRRDGLAVEAEARRRDMASIGMAGILVELIRIREWRVEQAAPAGLQGSSWRLEDLSGTGVLGDAPATLEFTEDGAAGSGSCNRFNGTVTIRGDSIAFGPLATTRKACPEAVMNQENRYLEALRGATRFEVNEPYLLLHGSQPQPLRFVRAS